MIDERCLEKQSRPNGGVHKTNMKLRKSRKSQLEAWAVSFKGGFFFSILEESPEEFLKNHLKLTALVVRCRAILIDS